MQTHRLGSNALDSATQMYTPRWELKHTLRFTLHCVSLWGIFIPEWAISRIIKCTHASITHSDVHGRAYADCVTRTHGLGAARAQGLFAALSSLDDKAWQTSLFGAHPGLLVSPNHKRRPSLHLHPPPSPSSPPSPFHNFDKGNSVILSIHSSYPSAHCHNLPPPRDGSLFMCWCIGLSGLKEVTD